MTTRPDDVPTAMRKAFSNQRIASAWNMVALADGPDRLAALSGFERLLAQQGLGLIDVATALTEPVGPSSGDALGSAFGNAFSGIFAETMGAARKASPAPSGPERTRTVVVQGADIPQTVHGRIRIEDERPTRSGTMLVFTVESHLTDGVRTVHGPIASFSDASIAKLRKAADPENPATMSVEIRHAEREGLMPSTRRTWFG